jgi:predicted Zn-dependent protease
LYPLYQGELHLLRGEVRQAEQCFSAGLGTPSSPHHWQFRQALLRVRVKMGKAAAAYREFGEAAYTFQALAALCQQEKSPGQLKDLVAAHRLADPDDPALALADAEVNWLEQDYEGALRLLRANRAGAAGFAWKTDDYLVRCLVKLKRTNEAIQEAEAVVKKKYGNQVLLVLAHASGGEVKQTIAATDKLNPPPYLLGNCYRDADLGPILKSEPFKAFREKYPEPKQNSIDPRSGPEDFDN